MLENQKHLFNLPNDITYLNCSYMSPMLKSVAQVGTSAIYGKDDPSTTKPEHFFESTNGLRKAFAQLINTTTASCAVIPSVSYGLANVAKNLKAGKGDNIVVADEQFPSNIYAWKALEEEKGLTIKYVQPPKEAEGRGAKWNAAILDAIDSNTKLIATGHVHWADGTKFDLKAFRKRADEVGAILVIDGTQSVGALPFDVQEIKPDALVCAGYKWLMGPYACGVAYYGEYFAQGKPIENNWMNRLHSEDFGNLVNYQDAYQPGAMRYDVGESANFILTPMLTRAIEQVNAWGPQNIQDYCEALTTPFIGELKALGCQIEAPEFRGRHLFGVRLPQHISMAELQQRFKEEQIFVSVRGNSIRIAPHLYNSADDLAHILETFKQTEKAL